MPKIIAWMFVIVGAIGFFALLFSMFLFIKTPTDFERFALVLSSPIGLSLMIFTAGLGGLRREIIPLAFTTVGIIGFLSNIPLILFCFIPSTDTFGMNVRETLSVVAAVLVIFSLLMFGTGVKRLPRKGIN